MLFGAIVEYIFCNYGNMVLIFSILFFRNVLYRYIHHVFLKLLLEDFCPLGCYAAYVDNCLATFRDCLSVPSRRVRSPSCLTLADRIVRLFQHFGKHNQHRLYNFPEERRTQLHRGEAWYRALWFLFICVRNVCWVFLVTYFCDVFWTIILEIYANS